MGLERVVWLWLRSSVYGNVPYLLDTCFTHFSKIQRNSGNCYQATRHHIPKYSNLHGNEGLYTVTSRKSLQLSERIGNPHDRLFGVK
jgi:hypothetical protein